MGNKKRNNTRTIQGENKMKIKRQVTFTVEHNANWGEVWEECHEHSIEDEIESWLLDLGLSASNITIQGEK